jgi:hypothetical protein
MNNKTGPEFAPIRNYVKDFPITVNIYDDKDKLVRTEKLNYGNSEDRSWLGKLSYWGWTNGHSVETLKDDA